MSNLHLLLDEANKHAPKGFDNVGAKNYRPWKDELSESTYTENFQLPRAINFVDGTVAAPTSVNGDVYVLTGSGVIDASWGTSTFGDWTRATNTIFTPITPTKGTICYDDTASVWKEFDGTVWAAAHFAITDGSGTTANGTAVDLGGTLTANANVVGAGFNVYLGATTKLGSWAADASTSANLWVGPGGAGTVNSSIAMVNTLVSIGVTDNAGGNSSGLSIDNTHAELSNNASGGSSSTFEIASGAATYTDSSAAQTGIQYAADYSATFVARSLVDKAYITGITGNFFDKVIDDSDDITEGVTNLFNATHTSEVTGSGALTLDKTAISNKTLVTAVGTDHVLIGDASDADNLKKVLVSDFLGGGGATEVGAGTDSLQQVGVGASAVGTGAISLGVNSATSFTKNVSIGHTAISSGQQSIALGTATATATGAIAIGNIANATFTGSISIGNSSDATGGTGSVAIGDTAQATAQGAVALGYLAGNLGAGITSVAIGQSSEASASDCIAIGNIATAKTGVRNIAIGQASQSTGSQASVAIGENAISSSSQSIAVGYRTRATSFNSVAIGSTAESNTGNYGISIGDAALTTGAQGVSIGQAASATNTRAICIGHNIKATAVNAIMIGGSTAAKTNVTADSVEFNFNEATSTIRLAKAADSWINTSANFGIGLNTGLGSKLHVKGTGATSGTTALLVENSAGTDLLSVLDDGSVGVGITSPTTRLNVVDVTGDTTLLVSAGAASTTSGTASLILNSLRSDTGVGQQTSIETFANAPGLGSMVFKTQPSSGVYTERMRINFNGDTGIGTSTITARLQVKGSGATSGTTALLVENSAGTDILQLRNDNAIGMYGVTPVVRATTAVASSVIVAGAGTNALQDDTYGGYTMAQVVQALQNIGVLT